MHILRHAPKLRDFAFLALRDLGIGFGFSGMFLHADNISQSDALAVVALLSALTGVLFFIRHVIDLLPIYLTPDGRIKGVFLNLERSACRRVRVDHDIRVWYDTVLETERGTVFLFSHHCSRSDLQRANEIAALLGVSAYQEHAAGKYRKIKPAAHTITPSP